MPDEEKPISPMEFAFLSMMLLDMLGLEEDDNQNEKGELENGR